MSSVEREQLWRTASRLLPELHATAAPQLPCRLLELVSDIVSKARARRAVAFGHAEAFRTGAMGVGSEMDSLMRRLLRELQSESTWMDVEDMAASHGHDQVSASVCRSGTLEDVSLVVSVEPRTELTTTPRPLPHLQAMLRSQLAVMKAEATLEAIDAHGLEQVGGWVRVMTSSHVWAVLSDRQLVSEFAAINLKINTRLGLVQPQ